jgi:hypothetical protein
VKISREQVRRRLLDEGWHFNRVTDKVEIYKRGIGRCNLPRPNLLGELAVRSTLHDAGLTHQQIEEFISKAVKS